MLTMSTDALAFIPTKSSLLKRKAPAEFQVVTFESHKPKAKKLTNESRQNDIILSKPHEVDMKRARHEVLKFGMSGFDPEKKEEAKVKLAISLGAKPPKNKYKNYKQLQEDKIKSRETEKQRLDFQQLGKNQLGKSNAKGKFFKRRNKEKGGLLEGYGKASLKEIAKTKGDRRNNNKIP